MAVWKQIGKHRVIEFQCRVCGKTDYIDESTFHTLLMLGLSPDEIFLCREHFNELVLKKYGVKDMAELSKKIRGI
jgi:uncharacterized protein YlaI